MPTQEQTVTHPAIQPIAMQTDATRAALRDVNNAFARETSFLDESQWQDLLDNAFAALCIDGSGALLIAFDHQAAYDNPNFNWFRERYDNFVYVDRIVIAQSHQGQGLAGRLYEELFHRTGKAGITRVVCEVNVDPPNPKSDAFHAKMGFCEAGHALLTDRAKTVRYLTRELHA